MLRLQTAPIKHWIETMGFELVKSDFFQDTLLNYYNLRNFGVCEEIITHQESSQTHDDVRFIFWNPWGDDFEVNSVNELSRAYHESLTLNPELS